MATSRAYQRVLDEAVDTTCHLIQAQRKCDFKATVRAYAAGVNTFLSQGLARQVPLDDIHYNDFDRVLAKGIKDAIAAASHPADSGPRRNLTVFLNLLVSDRWYLRRFTWRELARKNGVEWWIFGEKGYQGRFRPECAPVIHEEEDDESNDEDESDGDESDDTDNDSDEDDEDDEDEDDEDEDDEDEDDEDEDDEDEDEDEDDDEDNDESQEAVKGTQGQKAKKVAQGNGWKFVEGEDRPWKCLLCANHGGIKHKTSIQRHFRLTHKRDL